MKQKINLGAYGWRHKHWSGTFYPDDLPVAAGDDWRLGYYSNEFNAVLVPALYLKNLQQGECDDWLDSVHPEFAFYIQCNADLLACITLAELAAILKKLSPQLPALVLFDDKQAMTNPVKKQYIELADSLGISVIDATTGSGQFIILEDELLDFRSSRVSVEQFAAQMNDHVDYDMEPVIIVKHAKLLASNLSKFRVVLDIMGY